VAPGPPSQLARFKAAFPKQPISLAAMQNANGDWVLPTADSINKAVDAGGAAPLYALTNKVPGAYPLVWVDNLYAPAHGLSVAKTEGLAMTIRYLATTGQTKSTAVGEGRLPGALVAKALAAADALVRSNCTGTDRRVVSSADPGPLAPATATAMRSIGAMLHCEPIPVAPPSTTTTTPTTTPVPIDPGSVAPTGEQTPVIDPAAGAATSPTAATADATEAPADGGEVAVVRTQASRKGLLIASQLPLPPPSGAGTSDRLATFLLGVALFLLLRKPVGRLFRRLAT
jgi:hypothetical protein